MTICRHFIHALIFSEIYVLLVLSFFQVIFQSESLFKIGVSKFSQQWKKAMIKFYGYKKCNTCVKAEKFLQDSGVVYEFIDITQKPPSADELAVIVESAGITMNKLFNTSGIQYRELKIREKLPALTKQEILDLLASNGRLIKRPLIVVDEKNATVGFKEDQLRKIWKC